MAIMLGIREFSQYGDFLPVLIGSLLLTLLLVKPLLVDDYSGLYILPNILGILDPIEESLLTNQYHPYANHGEYESQHVP